MTATTKRPVNVAERIYQQLKKDIFDFQLLPGDRFSESEIAKRMEASRTPVREALYRLERDGYVQVHFRSGWQVRPFDFKYFEDLYDCRILMESESVRRLCEADDVAERLAELVAVWSVDKSDRWSDSDAVAILDETFHDKLVAAAGNKEMALLHQGVCERLKIIRRLDFTQPGRIEATYDEHHRILGLILARDTVQAIAELKRHIELSKNTVREITLHRLQEAKSLYNVNIKV